MGLCPQDDILFDNLTVSEHLYFYAQVSQRMTGFVSSVSIFKDGKIACSPLTQPQRVLKPILHITPQTFGKEEGHNI